MFKRVLFSDFLSTALSTSISIYVYWYAYHYTLDQKLVAMIGTSQLLAIFLSTLGGGIADRVNKLTFIKSLTALRLLLLGSFALLFPILKTETLLLAFMFLATILNSLLSPSLEALVPLLATDDQELYRFNAIVSSLTQTASILAVLLSALAISFLNFQQVLLAALAISICSFEVLIGTKLEQSNSGHQSILKNISQGVHYLFATAYIRNLIPVALLMNFSYWSIFVLLPKLSIDNFNFLKSSYSFLELAFSLGGVLGGWLFSKVLAQKSNHFTLFKGALLGQSLILLALGASLSLFPEKWAYAATLVLWGAYALVNTFVSITYFGSVQKNTPQNIMGSVIGSLLTLFSLVNPLAAMSSGLLVTYFSVNQLILIFALIMTLTSLLISKVKGLEKAFD